MRIGSLFSGAGGLDLAALEVWPGAEMAWHSEVNPAASKVLDYRWPTVPNLGDITEIDWIEVEPVDVLIAGFPCQDVSAAGRRAGLRHGTRSGLWHHAVQAIKALRPKGVLLENVTGLLSADGDEWPDEVHALYEQSWRWHSIEYLIRCKIRKAERKGRLTDEWDKRKQRELVRATRLRKRYLARATRERYRLVQRAIATVLSDLAALGFDAEWTCIRASDVGAAHRRDRIFILAYPQGGGWESLDGGTGRGPACGGGQWIPGRGAGYDVAAHTDSTRSQGAESAAGFDVPAGSNREPVALLPTPQAVDGLGGKAAKHVGGERPSGAKRAVGLPDAVRHLLPTPQVADVTGGHKNRSGARSNELLLPGVAEAYAKGALLPTPRATDGTKGGPNQRGSSGDLMLPSAVVQLLPTPRASDGSGGPNPLERAERMDDVETRVIRLGDQWGDYAPAIARQESMSRPAPAPTELSVKGNPRLSPAFAEWLMFWPAGWVTDPEIGLSRNDQLRCIGNGVVPPQASMALRQLLSRIPQPAIVPSEYGPQYVLPVEAVS